ncbi:MAG: hypothetical protein MUE85_01195 [Microscillaceae bacterium]|jgi:hypothetical protein|nr:hypothetical protein [Microscillaceae bacterium]
MRSLLTAVLLLVAIVLLYFYIFQNRPSDPISLMEANYAAEIEAVCEEMDLSAEYFKALVILESSGEKPAGTRFEDHVFKRLKEVRDGKSERYGRFTPKQLQILSENTLKKMATSWGPLQIMGYHCIPLGISLEQLQGDEAIRYGILWADKNYGSYLRRGDFANSFHIHNAGQPLPANGIPKTHDPDYIRKGLDYIKLFKEKKRNSKIEQ